MNNWISLEDDEYRRVWDRFYIDFSFKPTVYPKDWPTFTVNSPFVTFEIKKIYHDEDIDEFEEFCASSLRTCLEPEEYIYALDWQHESFYYSPYLQDTYQRISFYPDGDYSLFLSNDFSFGLLGHPWERSITIFGEQLIEQFIKHKPKLLEGIIRRCG
ncbi:DUF2716 domain-containing protein [Paenibacillus sp. ACRRX]|uniref:DUF2716 domain-containing protein n=1 Tax=unclassified Paenibacillus TaxID=185978 RepID=UPI001EF3EF30|nr:MULTISPECIES: DUF2716 domain-containing protein [unclassified Paenibacillus]MCG7406526.1 DUF2716 domain-containing protein [Paenibacillus sp. ACRRX]MDK8179558.1 DUF2716 domain-containing protein [Paenibacillus sp. UMB4589-SE434]